MRLYAFLLVVAVAHHARSATIAVPETGEKLIDVVPENLKKNPENTSSELEHIDQANTIKDVENKLRTKPEDIPVEVIVENAQPGLKINLDESDDIIRPVPDLRNPGAPQRQEHENQNPEYYASEQQTILKLKQSIIDAHNTFRQGFQGISDGIQNMLQNNEQVQTIQQNIQTLRDSFTAKVNNINETLHTYLNTDNPNSNEPLVEQTKLSFQAFENSLVTLKNDFNVGVKTLTDGFQVVANLKANDEESESGSSTAPAPGIQFIQNMQTSLNNTVQAIQGWFQNFGNQNNAPDNVQSDTESSSSSPGNFWGSFTNFFNPVQQSSQSQGNTPWFANFGSWPNSWLGSSTTAEPSTKKPEQTATKPSETSKPDTRLQKINNPEKPKEVEKLKDETSENQVKQGTAENESKKVWFYHPPGHDGDNNDVSGSGVVKSQAVTEEKEKLPEVEKPNEEATVEHKTEEVVAKTE